MTWVWLPDTNCFARKYIDENMYVAVEILGVTQASISYIESGKRGISTKSTRVMVSKYKLNMDWLTTGQGTEQIEVHQQETQLGKNISDVRNKILELEAKILQLCETLASLC